MTDSLDNIRLPISNTLSAEDSLKLLFPDVSLLSQLERMRIAAGTRIKGMLAGKRRSSSLGGSQEFADYRPYAPGDDIRRLDWNVYGRTGRAYMRQYWDEQELHVSMYVDVSRSMNFGGGRNNKLHYAVRFAACVGYAALSGDDRVSIKLFAEQIQKELPPLHGRVSSTKLFQFLAEAMSRTEQSEPRKGNMEAAWGMSALDSSMAAPFKVAGALPRRSGAAWIFTDAMFEHGVEETIISLLAAGQRVVLVHLLSPDELSPELNGELKLIDSELGTGKEVAIGHKILTDYRQAVGNYRNELQRICAERGVVYIFVNTETPLEQTVNHTLLSAQVLNR
ncbi:uncharacterized protein (DUF58 family) [Paenibacillus castaneae]|uniref:DUF58 domain-containing protein n=1 Tax=Paenibacillus castaneae TaxID=474957 RepID=UPI000C9B8D8A|nr:DUF58 domain-containing protein [Paenibacillus castaneae]NIK75482.1 uncharacterized protein (DUF58 family) [Paenibacillus castaneae]